MLFKAVGRYATNIQIRFSHKYICKMNRAYLRRLPEDSRFELTFQYNNPELKINRQFNFSRQSSEAVSSFTSRVEVNIDRAVKKKNKTDESLIKVSVILNETPLQNGDISCGEIFVHGNHVVLDITNIKYDILIDSPWVYNFTLPNSIMANFPIYPIKFESVNTDMSLSQFTWSKSQNKQKWELITETFSYIPSNADVDFYLKLSVTPKNVHSEGPALEVISSVKVTASPGTCPFESRHKFTKERCTGATFRVLTYNILANLYCDSDYTRQVLHPYCPAYALEIDYRKQLFIKEIMGFNSDIICLQEVDRRVYKHDLSVLLERLGYHGDYCQKRGETAEGLACFYDKSRFILIENIRLVLSEELDKNPIYAAIWKQIALNEKLKLRILDRSTVLQVNVLQCLDGSDNMLVVGNTHLYFHPDSDHIRLLQGAFVIKYLEDLLQNLRNKFRDKKLGLIICGDFNSVPECGIYQLYTTGFVQENHQDYQSKEDEVVSGITLDQSLKMSSACGTPQFTNFTAGFAACLDYIFYESNNFQVVQAVPMPSFEELTQFTALPSIYFPSDHISLVCDLKFL